MRARARARANGKRCAVETEWKQLLKEQAFKPLGKWKGFSWLRKVSCARALGARSGRARLRARVRARARACAKGIPCWVELEWKEPLKEQTFKPLSKRKGFSRQGKVSAALMRARAKDSGCLKKFWPGDCYKWYIMVGGNYWKEKKEIY